MMATIQIVLDKNLLKAADAAARKAKKNRSALFRDALEEHLRKLELRELDRREREGYRRQPIEPDEFALWEAEAVWPED